ncbi:hypothetical protein SmJEL517_g03773 [Synchytrium microbalum]|uniref:Uncharacterized protein n=1 Tax=Synchytrium microbalum TaxID=1806994 RepID=A0A507C1M2_9FUNG|nr:uncharacterized protein SmJEL517_g03773 [Synchytrium microbalum]TPX33321.1 hypothetical protein SmJEL517_g03773 [Synchytrium microbalum]
MADEKRKKLVFAICEFLQKSIKDKSVKEDDIEGLEVAIQCIGEAFGIDTSDPSQATLYSVKPATLPVIFDVFLATQAKKNANKSPLPPTATLPQTSTSPTSSPKPVDMEVPSPTPAMNPREQKLKAEELKGAGNKSMTEKNYAEAISSYTAAIGLDSSNAVYYANRAAAYSQNNEHEKAVEDSKRAIQIDPEYSKAYSRMGHAYFSLGKYQEAVTAYESGIKLDPGNATMKQSLAASQSKASEMSAAAPSSRSSAPGGAGGMPGLAGLAGLGGPGGLDIASLMSNPEIMRMASSMMSNPAIANMMSQPGFASMAQNMMSNPSALQDMMSNPDMARLAESMGGLGGLAAGAQAPGTPEDEEEL